MELDPGTIVLLKLLGSSLAASLPKTRQLLLRPADPVFKQLERARRGLERLSAHRLRQLSAREVKKEFNAKASGKSRPSATARTLAQAKTHLQALAQRRTGAQPGARRVPEAIKANQPSTAVGRLPDALRTSIDRTIRTQRAIAARQPSGGASVTPREVVTPPRAPRLSPTFNRASKGR